MNANRSRGGDEGNASFGLPDVLEKRKPGIDYAKQRRAEAPQRHGRAGEAHDRLEPRAKKDIPQRSLAERIRKASKGD